MVELVVPGRGGGGIPQGSSISLSSMASSSFERR